MIRVGVACVSIQYSDLDVPCRQAMRQSGMPEDTAEKIFEGFSQASRKRSYEWCLNVVESHCPSVKEKTL
jgi:hypothetical protein